MTKYEIKNTTQFKKDYKLAKRRGLNLELLKEIVTKLAKRRRAWILNTKIIHYPAIGLDTENATSYQIGCSSIATMMMSLSSLLLEPAVTATYLIFKK